MTTSERIGALIANALVAFGVGYFWLGAPMWAAVMWFSLANLLTFLRHEDGK